MNASTRMILVGVLAVVPVLASARSEYAECLAGQNQQRALRGFSGARPAIKVTRYYSSLDYGSPYAGFSTSSYPLRYSLMFDGYADMLAGMVRVCRQFKDKPEPPKFRVVGVKAPALNRAGNRQQDDDSD